MSDDLSARYSQYRHPNRFTPAPSSPAPANASSPPSAPHAARKHRQHNRLATTHTIAKHTASTHRHREHVSRRAASPNLKRVATHVVLSLDTSARLGSPSRVCVSVCVVAAPASCIRVHTRQPMHQRRRSHVAGNTALLLLHSRDMRIAPTAVGGHATTTPARQRTTRRHNHSHYHRTPRHRVINAADTTDVTPAGVSRSRDNDRCRRHDTQQRDDTATT